MTDESPHPDSPPSLRGLLLDRLSGSDLVPEAQALLRDLLPEDGDGRQHARDAVERVRPGGWRLIEAFSSGAHGPLPTVDDRKALVARTKGLAMAIMGAGLAGSGTPVFGGGR